MKAGNTTFSAVRERPPSATSGADALPLHVLESWQRRFPWVVAGITGAGADGDFDLGLFGETPVGLMTARWRRLIERTSMHGAVHARQVHGPLVRVHERAHHGLLVDDGYDGHATRATGLLLTISVADCVPVFLLEENARAIALLHAGWRGAAAGVLEQGRALLDRMTGGATRLWMHAGPSICGECYEVGPEVHEALGLPRPAGNRPVDLRRVLAERAISVGIEPGRISISEHCTRCGSGAFFSHRGGQPGRQMAVLGLRVDG